jgi:anti-sigma B factor antagonist
MDLTTEKNGTELTIHLSGELNTTTAPQLSDLIDKELNGVQTLFMDFAECDYVSSAGLRVILKAQKLMNAQGSMKVVHVNETIMEVFDITGFVDILTIE